MIPPRQLLAYNVADGPALTGLTATSLIGVSTTAQAAGKFVIPAQFLQPGCILEARAAGRISTLVTGPGTFTFDLRVGAVIAATSPAFALNVVAKVNVSWELRWRLDLRTAGGGTTAAFLHTGVWTSEAVVGSPLPSAGGSGSLLIPASAPAPGTGFDSTAVATLDLFGTWSVNNAANTIQLHQWSVEALNY